MTITAPQGAYHGAFVNYFVNPDHVACFEQMAGEELDIALRFANFQEMEGKGFPGEEARFMQKRGGALYLVLEPGSGKGTSEVVIPYEMGKIAAGRYDRLIRKFAKQAGELGGPLFLTFRPSPGVEISAGKVAAAYLRIKKIFADQGANDVTWVWGINLADPTALIDLPKDNFDWLAVTAYDEAGLEKLTEGLPRLMPLGKPILVEFASRARGSEKASFINRTLAMVGRPENGIKAFVYFNVSRKGKAAAAPWSIRDEEEKKAYQDALRNLDSWLKERILSPAEATLSPVGCEQVETRYFSRGQSERIAELKEQVADIERGLKEKQYVSVRRMALAEIYLELAALTEDPAYYGKAENIINGADQAGEEGIRYHPEMMYVEKYFEVILEMAKVYSITGKPAAAKELYERALRELDDGNVRVAQQVDGYSAQGYRNKLKLELAQLWVLKNDRLDQAAQYFTEVADWSKKEASRGWLFLWWRGEKREEVKYNEAKANLGLARVHFMNSENEKALELYRSLLSWPRVGEEDGFMDLAYGALFGIIQTCTYSEGGRAGRQACFAGVGGKIDWGQFNTYSDLKRSFGIEDFDLSDGKKLPVDRWRLIFDGLSGIELLPIKKGMEELRDLLEGEKQ